MNPRIRPGDPAHGSAGPIAALGETAAVAWTGATGSAKRGSAGRSADSPATSRVPPVVDLALPRLAPPDPAVLAEALAGEPSRARHDGLAARIPALGALEVSPPPAPSAVPAVLRVAAWNAERLKHAAASAALVACSGADVVLMSEVDLGMARSGDRHTASDLARALGFGFVYGVEFVELGLGDARETRWHAGQRNSIGFHGNAILSRFRLDGAFMVRLDDGGAWFGAEASADQRRIGGRMALAARLADAPRPLWVVEAHLESRSTPDLRAVQMRRLLAALAERIGDAPCVIGGDFNTLALPRGDALPEAALRDPSGAEPLFAAAAAAGFAWAKSNTAHVTSRTRPDGEPLPPFTRIDWLLVRGLVARAPATLAALGPDGLAISDHDLVAADVVP